LPIFRLPLNTAIAWTSLISPVFAFRGRAVLDIRDCSWRAVARQVWAHHHRPKRHQERRLEIELVMRTGATHIHMIVSRRSGAADCMERRCYSSSHIRRCSWRPRSWRLTFGYEQGARLIGSRSVTLVITPQGADEIAQTYVLRASPAQDLLGLRPQLQWSDLRLLRAYRCWHSDGKENASTRAGTVSSRWNSVVVPTKAPAVARKIDHR
jgi:hypothetical protein